jgi:hypothetical protein
MDIQLGYKVKLHNACLVPTPCMTCWRMGYSAHGVFTGSSHVLYARKVLGSFGCRRVASMLLSTNIGNSSLLTIHSDETSRTLRKVS